MSCSCGCSPCCCPTAGEIDPTECYDPGIIKEGYWATVLSEGLCPRRLASFKGFNANGTRNMDANADIVPGIFFQDAEGKVGWTDRPKYLSPEKVIRVGTTAQASDAANYINYIVGKESDGSEKILKGSSDTASGNWKLVWVASLQKFTTVPDKTADLPDLCTTLETDVVFDPSDPVSVIKVLSTAHLAQGVSVKGGGYEFVVLEVIDEDFARVELIDDIGGPVVLESGETICNIGFRPCPRGSEAYADELIACLNNTPVSIETPANVNNVPVPGFYWRDQLGRICFVPAPVNGTTGLVEAGLVLSTPTAPAADVANLPVFRSLTFKPTWLAAKVTVGSKVTGSATGPTFAIEDDLISVTPHSGSFDMATVPGYVSGSSVAICRAVTFVDVGPAGSESLAQVKVANLVLSECWIDSSLNFAYKSDSGPFEVPLTNDAFSYELVTSGDGVSFAKLEIVGFR